MVSPLMINALRGHAGKMQAPKMRQPIGASVAPPGRQYSAPTATGTPLMQQARAAMAPAPYSPIGTAFKQKLGGLFGL